MARVIRAGAHVARGNIADAHSEAAALLIAAARVREQAIEHAQGEIRRLALAAAEKIIGHSVALDPETITSIVHDVMARMPRARGIEVRVHPDDAAQLCNADWANADLNKTVRIATDAEITRGGCVVRSEMGEIDARIETRIDVMAELLGCPAPDRSQST